MAEVKFILIKHVPDYLYNTTDGYTTETYLSKLAEAKAVPGAVIFGQYKKSREAQKVYYELWANGQLYSIGGGGDVQVFEGTEEPWVYFSSGHNGANLEVSDGAYYIKLRDISIKPSDTYITIGENEQAVNYNYAGEKTLNNVIYYKYLSINEDVIYLNKRTVGIANICTIEIPQGGNAEVATKTETTVEILKSTEPKNERTGYVLLNAEHKTELSYWHALNGNVSAENVYFPNGIRHNQAWGKVGQLTTSKVDCIGYNLLDVMKHFLLVSQAPPTPQLTENFASDPTVTVTADNTLTLKVYSNASGTTQATSSSSNYLEVGTKFYIPESTKFASISDYKNLCYEGYNLTLSTASGKNPTTIETGKPTISGMTFGYWSNETDATNGDTSADSYSTNTIKEGTKKTGIEVAYDLTQTSGTCSLALTASNFGYTTTESDSVDTDSPNVNTSLSLPITDLRTFVVQEGSGYIKLQGTNGNTWKATRDAYSINQVGPIYVANNEFDSYTTTTLTGNKSSKVLTGAPSITNPSQTFNVIGYYPIYSNHYASNEGGELQATLKMNSNNTYTNVLGNTTKWGSAVEGAVGYNPIIIEYPVTKKRVVVKIYNSQKTFMATITVTSTSNNGSVTYNATSNNTSFVDVEEIVDRTIGSSYSQKYVKIKTTGAFGRGANLEVTFNNQ